MSHKIQFLIVASIAMLTACATPKPNYYPVYPMDKTAEFTSIAILPDGLPEKPTASDGPIDFSAVNTAMESQVNSGMTSPAEAAIAGPLAMLLVAAVDANIDANRNRKFNNMLEEQGFDGPSLFEESFRNAFEAKGLAVEFSTGIRKNRAPMIGEQDLNYTSQTAIDIFVSQYGYRSTMRGWYPSFTATIQLEDKATGALLMREAVSYGTPQILVPPNTPDYFGSSPTIIVPFDSSYGFMKVDDFVKVEPARAVEGLELAISRVAEAIAKLIEENVADQQDEPTVASDSDTKVMSAFEEISHE